MAHSGCLCFCGFIRTNLSALVTDRGHQIRMEANVSPSSNPILGSGSNSAPADRLQSLGARGPYANPLTHPGRNRDVGRSNPDCRRKDNRCRSAQRHPDPTRTLPYSDQYSRDPHRSSHGGSKLPGGSRLTQLAIRTGCCLWASAESIAGRDRASPICQEWRWLLARSSIGRRIDSRLGQRGWAVH